MLYAIGLGLGDEDDITVKGLKAVKKCSKVYMEAYTSLLSFGITSDGLSTLEKVYGKPIIVADREMVEEKADDMLFEAQVSDVAFLVVGDPFGATTHSDLVVRAKKLGLKVKVVSNASIMIAVGVCGLQLYSYGETVSIPFFTDTWRPDSFYEKIKCNRKRGLHTLCLLDIKVKEPSFESLCRGKKVYEPPRYMTINTAIEQLLEVAQNCSEPVYNEETICVGMGRVGCEDQVIVAGTMKQLLAVDFGDPLHCLVIVGDTHPVDEEMLKSYKIGTSSNNISNWKKKGAGMLYVIGIGLGDEDDITVKGLKAIKKCSKVYMEAYTSMLSFGITSDGLSTLEKVYGKPIIVADREMVEEKADDMLLEAQVSDVAFLVVGDPFGATTHSDLVVRAKKLGVEVKVVHNASVMIAVGACGLELYRYGETVSIPFFTDTWRPDSFYEKIKCNRKRGLHTLCLLDIKVKEPSFESLCRGKKVYEPQRFMTINTAIEQLLEVAQNRSEPAYNEDTACVGMARLGCEDQVIVSGSLKQLLTGDFGRPLHCLVIAGDIHPVEEEMLKYFKIDKSSNNI
ncbi:hypothetical protein CASFOL_021298 [Castilleja foliolosa]|uniref:diphthine methyl ester synthase n=1 Tax=Castilleja foliolosa TaxID=1961234 RepID=A0ABD3CXD8_9LAMI